MVVRHCGGRDAIELADRPQGKPVTATPCPEGCGTCTLFCKLMGIKELENPFGVWCKHCDTAVGCNIHANRPAECASFICG
jgi:hypothetical protein